jgi:energy-coupling factor transporter ATP-binding protein EcfA2
MYRTRFLEKKVADLVKVFGAVLVTGPRQAGKTSLLSHLAGKLFPGAVQQISFDTPSEIDAFRRDPELFFANHPGLLFLDVDGLLAKHREFDTAKQAEEALCAMITKRSPAGPLDPWFSWGTSPSAARITPGAAPAQRSDLEGTAAKKLGRSLPRARSAPRRMKE